MKRLFTAMLMFAAACAPATDSTEQGATSASTAAQTASAEPAPPPVEEKPMSYYQDKVVDLKTSKGTITIRFFPEIAPNHVKNFIDLAEKGFYNGTRFHRVIPGFMIQGGDPNTKSGDPGTWGTGGSDNRVNAEFSAKPHKRGIVSMARGGHDINSARSQFFIVVADSTFLDNQYSVFGEVVKGMDVADAIVDAPKNGERPIDPVAIESATVRAATDAEKASAQ